MFKRLWKKLIELIPLNNRGGIDIAGGPNEVNKIVVPTDATLDITQEISISIWINPASVSNFSGLEGIVNKDPDGSTADVYSLDWEGGSGNGLRWLARTSGNSIIFDLKYDKANFSTNTWFHIFATYSKSVTDAFLYVDNSLVASNTSTSSSDIEISTDDLIIGFFPQTDDSWNGILNEVAIWNTVLSTTERALLASANVKRMPLQIKPSNLKLYLPLDDLSEGTDINGQTFKDLSGNGNDGIGTDADNDTASVAEEVLSYPSNVIIPEITGVVAPAATGFMTTNTKFWGT